jgi:hypothetical protein
MRTNFLGEASFLETILQGRTAPRWQNLAVAAFTIGIVLVGAYILGAIRLQYARELNARAQARLSSSRLSLRRSQTEWTDLRVAIRQAQRLRALRLSGTQAVLRLVRVGNALPKNSWLTSFADEAAGFDVRGGSSRFDSLSSVLDVVSAATPATVTITASRRRDNDDVDFELRQSEDRR